MKSNTRDFLRIVVAFVLLVGSAFLGEGCMVPRGLPIYGGGYGYYGPGYGGWGGAINVQPGGYAGTWGYSPVAINGGQYWGGGAWGGQQWQPGYYQSQAPFFQGGAYGGVPGPMPGFIPSVGSGPSQPGVVTSGPTLFIQNGQIVPRSACDQAGCDMVLPGAPGPQIVPPVGAYPGIGSVQGVAFGPYGAIPGIVPRPN